MIPGSAWLLGWTFLLGQVLLLAEGGLSDANGVSITISVVLSVLVVSWVSAGVLRARAVRTAAVWIVLGLAGLFELIGALVDPAGTDVWTWLELVTTLVEVGALYSFCSSPFYVEQRDAPAGTARPDISALIAIAVAVGITGGLAAADATQVRVTIF